MMKRGYLCLLFFATLTAVPAVAQTELEDALRKAMDGDRRKGQEHPAQPQQTQPAASAGFTVAARNGPAGQALTRTFAAGGSAKTAFRAILKQAAAYFDRAPMLQAAFGDQQDLQINAFFRSVYKGAPIRGLIAVGVQSGKGTAALLFDREDQFARSLPVLLKQMSATLPKAQGGDGGGGGGASLPAAQLVKTQLTDGSGWIGLAPGWQITGAYKGVVDAQGPNGQFLSLGGYQQVFRNGYPNSTLMFGPYRPPWPAWQLYADIANKGVLSRGQGSIRLLEQSPEPWQGGQAAWLSYEFVAGGAKTRGLAYIITKPLNDDIGSWFFYSSYVGAPAEHFAQALPTLWQMWKSWSVNPAVFRERMDAALRSMRETYRIIQDIHANQMHTYENTNYAWDETIRGVTMIEDISTRTRAEVDTNHVDWWVNELNRQGYPVRVVPIGELAP
jgi:hypothetical protein